MHSSEQHIKSLPVHAVIINDGDLYDLRRKVVKLLKWFMDCQPWPTPSANPTLVF